MVHLFRLRRACGFYLWSARGRGRRWERASGTQAQPAFVLESPWWICWSWALRSVHLPGWILLTIRKWQNALVWLTCLLWPDPGGLMRSISRGLRDYSGIRGHAGTSLSVAPFYSRPINSSRVSQHHFTLKPSTEAQCTVYSNTLAFPWFFLPLVYYILFYLSLFLKVHFLFIYVYVFLFIYFLFVYSVITLKKLKQMYNNTNTNKIILIK